MVEHATVNRVVVGSSPTSGANRGKCPTTLNAPQKREAAKALAKVVRGFSRSDVVRAVGEFFEAVFPLLSGGLTAKSAPE